MPGQHYPDINENGQNHAFEHFKPPNRKGVKLKYALCFFVNPTHHGGGDKTSPPYYLILNNSKTVIANPMKLWHFS